MNSEKVTCETPTPNKQATRIDQWKYQAVRRAILRALKRTGEGLLFKDLPSQVERHLSKDEKHNLGSLGWYTTCVKLDLEVKGEIMRVPGAKPQRLLKK